jgi:serine/threonine protein kinase
MPADLQKARELFLHVVGKLPPEQWEDYVRAASCGDVDLEQQVGQLLQVHREAGSFLDRPAAAVGATRAFTPMAGEEAAAAPAHEAPGTVIGPYKLLQQIGEGGMGTVFMAEQSEPIQRKVALKIIKAGMDTRQVIARFEAERQALAMMDHVNIARVLDAGATDAGKPYFVMELVHGVPITKYCDDNHLTPRERLDLFVPVCQAIQHAHQKGIIHRDIKPSNVMITLYDGKPVPKVIDFGVAKATEQKLTERTLFTQDGTTIGTLEYMSPEQAEMSALGIDTRSDIYSLGVLLYELLTGSTPLTHKRMKEAAYAEILRMIKEEEPPKPSTRLSDSGEALASISAQRHTDPAKLTKLVRGELDWIVMKTLEKDRNRRYETANGFAQDLQRYLADEPVQACPPSAFYRCRKFGRRNKGLLTAAMLIAIALVAGTIVSTWQAIRATNAETLAEERLEGEQKQRTLAQNNAAEANGRRQEADAARKEAIANLQKAREAVDQMLTRVSEEKLLDTPQMEPLRKALLQDALRFYQEFLKQKASDPQSRLGTGEAWRRIGSLQVILAEYAPADRAYREAIAILEALLQEFPAESRHRSALAAAHGGLNALHLWHVPDHAKAALGIKRSEELWGELARQHPDNLGHQCALGWNHLQRAQLFWGTGKAVEAARQAAAISDRLTAAEPDNAGYRRLQVTGYNRLGEQLHATGQPREAEQAYRRALTFKEASSGGAGMRATMLLGLAMSMIDTGRDAEIEQICRDAVAHASQMAQDYPKTVSHQYALVSVQLGSGIVLERQKRKQEAEKFYYQATATARKAVSEAPSIGAWGFIQFTASHDRLLKLLTENNRLPEAIQACRDAIKVLENRPLAADFPNAAFSHRDVLFTMHRRLGDFHAELGQWKEATADFAKAIELKKDDPLLRYRQALAGLQLGDVAGYRKLCADILGQLGPAAKTDSAQWAVWTCVLAADAVADWKVVLQLAGKAVADHPKNYRALNHQGAVLYRASQYQESLKRLTEAEAAYQHDDKKLNAIAYNWLFLAMAHHRLGQIEQAKKWHDKAVQWIDQEMQKQPKEPATANPFPWNRRLTLQLFRREAEELLKQEFKK